MPVYEYICQKCNVKFSVFQHITTSKNHTSCPRCASGDVKKVMSACNCSSGTKNASSTPAPSAYSRGGG